MPTPAPKTTTEIWAIERFKPDEKELARHDDPDEIRRMGEDMLANGQLQPIAATEDGRMIFGHGRWLAARAVGIKTLEVKVYPASTSDTKFMLTRAAENLKRKELTGYRKWLLASDLMCGNAQWTQQDLAKHLSLDPATISKMLSPSKCIAEVQEALRLGKIDLSSVYGISKVEQEAQGGMLAYKLAGASRNQIEEVGKKIRSNPSGEPPVKVARVRCDLPGNICVVVSGEGVSLDESIEALGEAMKAMKKARDEGYTAKTFAAAMKDRSKKG